MNIIKKIRDENKSFSIYSITILSFCIFFIWMTIYAVVTFTQFSFINVIAVSSVFLFLFTTLLYFSFKEFFKDKLQVNISNLIISICISYILILFADNLEYWVTAYFKTYPLLDAELVLGWNSDSAFHVSLIQSIMNFAYPSIALHDTPLIGYHVLSHYVDAILLSITGQEPWDSYGLFFHYKIVLLISSILFLVAYLIKKTNIIIFIFSLVVMLYLIINTGHAIGSHGLWFPSLILILFSPMLFEKVLTQEYNLKNFLSVLIFIILISMGKISTGFMLAAFIGFILLQRHPKNWLVYASGVIWTYFFYVYSRFMVKESSPFEFSQFLENFYSYIISPFISFNYTLPIILLILLIIFYKANIKVLISAILCFFVLSLSVSLNSEMNNSSIYYFEYGFLSIIILMGFYLMSLKIKNSRINDNRGVKIFLIVVIILLLNIPTNNLNNSKLNYIDNRYLKISTYKPKYKNRPLYDFRKNLYQYIETYKLNTKNTILYVPKDLFEGELTTFQGSTKKGLLIYAITGIPLVYGIDRLAKDYGYVDYKENSLWTLKKDFNIHNACNSISRDYIIIVESIFEPKFTFRDCSKIR